MSEQSSIIIVIIFIGLAIFAQLAHANHDYMQTEFSKKTSPENCAQVSGHHDRIICTCDETACDELKFDWPTISGQAKLVETISSGLRFHVSSLHFNKSKSSHSSLSTISVNVSSKYQTILGFGGAFTDAATKNIASLSKKLGEKLISNYFGPNGLLYTFGRVPIGGSDFSTRTYSYDDANYTDYNLKQWHLAPEDLKYKIPAIKQAIQMTNKTGKQLKLFASPWSPPEWMKTSHSFTRGHLIDDDNVYKSYAEYLVKFYKTYETEHQIRFWGATVQNEPFASNLPFNAFNSLQMSAKETIRLVVEHLGPALEAAGYTKENFKLMVGDDSLLFVNQQVSALEDSRLKKYVSGLAFHWYTSGLIAPYYELSKLFDRVKNKIDFVIMSEACTGSMKPWSKHVDLGSWDRGETYAIDIIEDLRRHTSAWIDWNIALDLEGGPNWAKNYVDSPIIVDADRNQFYKQPMFYVLAHFSRFILPDSVIISSELKNSYVLFEKLMIVSAINEKTNHLIVNILNKAASARTLNVQIETGQTGSKPLNMGSLSVAGKSINTLVLKL